ncbi:MAG: sulfite exporter TauE/SafE family protein, partial [Actinobacteria bacterium]|nr:sulfite exporter TauE/SafE family protein [Actinomycetota bacterium]
LCAPAFLAALRPAEAVTVLLACGVTLNALVLFGEGRRRETHGSEVKALVLAALPGLAVGLVVLRELDAQALQVMVGMGVLGATWAQSRNRPAHRDSRRTVAGFGLVAGVLTTATSLNGPPVVLWLRRRGLRAAALRDSVTASFLALNLAGAAVVVAFGHRPLTAHALTTLAVVAPAVVAGHRLGAEAARRVAPHRRDRLIVVALVLAGVGGVAGGLL